MSKSRNTIEHDFKKAKKQADELDRLARDLKNMVLEDYENTMSQIKANWQSKNADNYILKCQAVREQMLKSAHDLYKTADTVRLIAKNIYDAEMKTTAIAETRTYK